MKRLLIATLAGVTACTSNQPAEHYGFVARLGRDTISVERITRQGNSMTVDGVDRFPRVRQRHTEITLAPDGALRHLVMDVTTPSEPENQRKRHIVADVTNDSVIMVKRDGTGGMRWAFGTGGATAMPHVPQMYSLYELYFAAALQRMSKPGASPAVDTAVLRQFYIDREFDRFPLHHGVVYRRGPGKALIQHDWLAGTGAATFDSAYRLLTYSGASTTYLVDVARVADVPDVQALGAQFVAEEAKAGGVVALSPRDTARATVGAATMWVDYGRPTARGRQLLGNVIPFGDVWRTGANAATQFSTSVPLTIGDLRVPAGKYTLWTVPRETGVELIVNKQTGQWGTGYDPAQNLGRTPMKTETLATPVEKFTISITGTDDRHGTLAMEWGPFRWTAPLVVGEGKF